MPIQLGLTRITLLLSKLGNPHLRSNFIHIAGTNGKGSICSYISSVLYRCLNDLKVGKFTSPHLVNRHDSISVNDVAISSAKFDQTEKKVQDINNLHKIGATEFEILTAVAFEIFYSEKVDIAVVEVGLGGRFDATNVIEPAIFDNEGRISRKGVLATGISKIGLDHENILGSTLNQIALQKAGIVKAGIPNVIDGSNSPDVLKVFEEVTNEENSPNYPVKSTSEDISTTFGTIARSESPLKGYYQLQNLSVSLKIIEVIFPRLKATYPSNLDFNVKTLKEGINQVSWPGRLQSLQLLYNKNKPVVPVLLDGAHNGQAAQELSNYLRQAYGEEEITFVLAVTKGKDLNLLFKTLIRPRDRVVLTKFGKVDGMPWIQATDPDELKRQALKYTQDVKIERSIPEVFEEVHGNVVVCGSLYLVGEVLRLHRSNSDI